jgi:hypothetical protein
MPHESLTVLVLLLLIYRSYRGWMALGRVVEIYNFPANAPVNIVNIDWECQAEHVALSPWRHYMDMGAAYCADVD